MSVLTATLVIISAIFFYLYSKKEAALQNESANWLPTEATIVSSKIRKDWNKNTGKPKSTYHFELQYSYEVNNTKYSGSRYAFHGHTIFKSKANAEKILEEYPAGKTIIIYYQPKNPEESVIKR